MRSARHSRWIRRAVAGARRRWHRALVRRLRGMAARLRRCPPVTRVYAGLFLLFALLYAATGTRDYTFDAVAYALQIQRFGETGEWRWLFHPHHVLFNGLGLLSHRLLCCFLPDLSTLAALQAMNPLLGAAGVALFAGVAGRACRDRGAGLLAAAGLGLSYGYWTCSTDGRANIAGVVALVAVLGVMAGLADVRRVRAAEHYARLAGALGAAHAVAVLLHQSHALLLPAALVALYRSPGRPRRLGVATYLAAFLGVGGVAYAAAARLAEGASGPIGVLSWATTYAREGHWWSLDIRSNLSHDVNALVHAVIAQPRLSGIGMTGWAPLGALLVTTAVLGLLGFVAWRWLGRRGAAGALWARLSLDDGGAGRPPQGAPSPGGLGGPARGREAPSEPPSSVGLGGPAPGAPPSSRGLGGPAPGAPPSSVGLGGPAHAVARQPGRGVRRRLAPVLLVWVVAYAAFFTVWNPGYFVFWVPVLVPLWLMLAMSLAAAPTRLARRPDRWAGAVAALALLAVNNMVVGIAPHARAENNGRLQKALAVGAHTLPGATVVLAGAGDDADAEVYVPYFTGRGVISVNALLGRAPGKAHGLASLRAEIDKALAGGRRVYVHEELLSSEGPYGALAARHGLTRSELVAFLRRHYRLGRPARWSAPVDPRWSISQRK